MPSLAQCLSKLKNAKDISGRNLITNDNVKIFGSYIRARAADLDGDTQLEKHIKAVKMELDETLSERSSIISQAGVKVNPPSVPPVLAVRANLLELPRARKGKKAIPADEQKPTPDVASGIKFLGDNPERQTAVRQYAESPEFNGPIETAIEGLPANNGDPANFIRTRLANAMMTFVGQNTEEAFNEDGSFKASVTGGFPFRIILTRAVRDFLDSADAKNVKPGSFSLNADVQEGQRPASETMGQAMPTQLYFDETGDFLNVRKELIKPWVGNLAAVQGVDVLIQDEGTRLSNGRGGVDLRKVNKAALDWANKNRATFMAHMSTTMQALAKKHEVDQDVVNASLYANPYFLTGTGSGMSIADAKATLNSFTGGLPSWIQIVDRPDWLTPTGEPVKGVYVSDGTNHRIVINAANHSTNFDLILTLLHEAIHLVWDNLKVQRFAKLLTKSETGTIQGYDGQALAEELAIRGVTGQWVNQQSRPIWIQLVDAAWSAVRELFGFEPTNAGMRSFIFAEAMRSISGSAVRQQGVVRYNTGLQIYRNLQEVLTAQANPSAGPEERQNIGTIAAATGTIIPESVRNDVAAWQAIKIDPTAPSPVRADLRARRQAGRWLNRLVDLSDMAFAPTSIAGINIGIRDVAANAVLTTVERIRSFTRGTKRTLDTASKQLATATKDYANVGPLQLKAQAAEQVASLVLDQYQENIQAQARLGRNIGQREQQALLAARGALGDIKVKGPTGIAPALTSIAERRPLGVDPLAWLQNEQAMGWPSNAGTPLMSTAVYDFLAGASPALKGATPEIDRLTRLQTERIDAQQKIDQVRGVFRSLGSAVKSAATPLQFAKLYGVWRTANKEALAEAREYSAGLTRATDSFNALTIALETLERVQSSPEFQGQWAQATEQQNAGAKRDANNGIVTDWAQDGDLLIRDPMTGLPVRLETSVFGDTVEKTAKAADDLIKNIDLWLDSHPNDPPLEATYRRLKGTAQAVWVSRLNALLLTGQINPELFTWDWLKQVPRRLAWAPLTLTAKAAKLALRGVSVLTGGEVTGRALVYNLIGGHAGMLINRYMSRQDHANDAIRAAEDSRQYGADAIKRALYNQAKFHGLHEGLSIGQAVKRYEELFTNSIFGNGQNAGVMMKKPGDTTSRGLFITQADIDAATLQHQYSMAVHNGVNREKGGVSAEVPFWTETEKFFRRAINYGLKMQRRASLFGMDFSNRWEKARRLDEEAGGGWVNRMKLLFDLDTFIDTVNSMVESNNPTYRFSDPVQQEAFRNRYARGGKDWQFDNIDHALDWLAEERNRIINIQAGKVVTDPVTERLNAERFLVDDLDRSVRLFMDSKSNGAESESRVQGVGNAEVTSLTGRSSFTKPRGNQVAPNSFYDYTLGSDVNRLLFNSAAMRYYQKMELDVLTATIKSLEEDARTMGEDFKKFDEANYSRIPGQKYWNKRKFVDAQNQQIKAGKLMTNMRALDSVLVHLRATRSGISSVMERADVEDGAILRTLSRFEVISSMMKLGTAGVQFTNLLGASQVAPLLTQYARAQGKFGIFDALSTALGQIGSTATNVYRTAITAVAGNKPMENLLRKHKVLFLGLADHFTRQMQQRQSDIDYLAAIGVHRPPKFIDQLGRTYMQTIPLASTSGQVTGRPGSTTEAIINYAASPFGLLRNMSTWINSTGESFGLRTQVGIVRQLFEGLKAPGYQAMELRASRGADMLAPLTPAELGERSQSGLNWIRDMFLPAGNLEKVIFDYWTNAKASGDPKGTPLVPPGIERDVAQHALSKGNLINDSDKGEGLKGRGVRGSVKSAVFRFMSYPIMLTNLIDQVAHKDIRDTKGDELRHLAAAVALVAVLAVLAMGNLGGRQLLTEWTTGKVPSVPTPKALMEEGLAGWAKGFVIGGANLFGPLFGDFFSGMMTGQKGKDPTDLSSLVPGVGAAASIGKMIKQIAQTGDAYYPVVSMLKQQAPQFEMIYNQTPEGQAALAQQNAQRALRSTAGEIETREVGGGSVGKLTPTSVDARDALLAAGHGDRAGFDKAVANVVARAVANGGDPDEAKKSFLRTLGSRAPEMSVFGKKLTDEERALVTSRMTDSQKAAFDRAIAVGATVKSWSGGSLAGSRGRRRGGYLRPVMSTSTRLAASRRKSKKAASKATRGIRP